MAMTKTCDRCGAVIKPIESRTGMILYQGLYHNGEAKEYDLCVSCAYRLKKWMNRENDNG